MDFKEVIGKIKKEEEKRQDELEVLYNQGCIICKQHKEKTIIIVNWTINKNFPVCICKSCMEGISNKYSYSKKELV